MAARTVFAYDDGKLLGLSIQRLADGQFYVPASAGFAPLGSVPDIQILFPLPEGLGIMGGSYSLVPFPFPTPVSIFADGEYAIRVHDMDAADAGHSSVVAILALTMANGDDATATFPGSGSFSIPGIEVNFTLGSTPPVVIPPPAPKTAAHDLAIHDSGNDGPK